MNRTTSPLPPLCSGARGRGDHRKSTFLPPRCAVVDRHHVPLKHSWADAATPTQLDTIPARARANGVSASVKTNNLISNDNPESDPASDGGRPGSATALTWAGLGARVAGLVSLAGGRLFVMSDREAHWRGWQIERRCAGLGRRYRDPRFDTLSPCPHCGEADPTAAESFCAACSGTGRLVRDQALTPLDR